MKKTPCGAGGFVSTPGRTRIPNLLIRSQTLYPIELRAHVWRRACEHGPSRWDGSRGRVARGHPRGSREVARGNSGVLAWGGGSTSWGKHCASRDIPLMRGILHPAAPGGVLRPANERVIALLKEANPVPDLDRLPETQHRWPAVDGRIGADDDSRSSIESKNDLADSCCDPRRHSAVLRRLRRRLRT